MEDDEDAAVVVLGRQGGEVYSGKVALRRTSASLAMRLAFVIESNTDRRLVEGLGARFDLTVVARSRRITEFPPRPSRQVRQITGPADRARYAAWLVTRLAGAHGRELADAVLVQGYGPAALAANLAARLGGPPVTMLVCNPAERYYRCRARAEGGPPFRRAELALIAGLGRANARIGRRYAVLSEHLRDVVRGQGARGSVELAPVYGVDLEVFSPDDRDAASTRAALGVGPDQGLLFFSSRLAPEKDGETVLRAVAALAAEGRDLRLLIRARDHSDLVALAERHGVADRLLTGDMVDPGPELASLLRAADVVVQGSREEGLGFAVLEALACGTAVVASAVGGLRETILDGRTGWSCPPGEAGAMAVAIAHALDDPQEAHRRTEAGRRLVAERFASDRAYDALTRVLAGG